MEIDVGANSCKNFFATSQNIRYKTYKTCLLYKVRYKLYILFMKEFIQENFICLWLLSLQMYI